MKHKKDSFLDLLEYYFSTYLPVAKGLSQTTIISYKATFRILLEYMYTVKGISSDRIGFDTLTDETVIGFLDWLESERNCVIATRNQRLSALAAFAAYAQNRNFMEASVFRNNLLKVPKKKCQRQGRSFFTRDEVKILFELPRGNKETELRDKTLLCFMYASGTRAQEVCNLAVGDIQFHPDRATVRIHGKGQKIRMIGIPSSASNMLKKYIIHRRITDQEHRHVFSSQTHEKMTVSCIEEIYAKYISKAKVENPELFKDHYTPHSMRHTTATHMLEAGVPLIVVKNFLGHASLQTTQIYAEITQDIMNRQLSAWNEKWFIKDEPDMDNKEKDNIPGFLK